MIINHGTNASFINQLSFPVTWYANNMQIQTLVYPIPDLSSQTHKTNVYPEEVISSSELLGDDAETSVVA